MRTLWPPIWPFSLFMRRTPAGLLFAVLCLAGSALARDCPPSALPAGQAPPMQLARSTATERNQLPQPLARYWVSEKYDGVRAWWDGHQLRTRQGHPIAAPAWFTAGWPCETMDGELWAGRGRFAFTAAVLARRQPQDADWRQLRFMVFDLPLNAGPFEARLTRLRQLDHMHGRAAAAPDKARHWHMAPQWRERSFASLQSRLQRLTREGAEGLMLHDGEALHRAGRSASLLKFKPVTDGEAVVLAHEPGRGRLAGRLGALRVRDAQGRVFRIGTGFSDAERSNPPPVGSTISYTHQGWTEQGLPRFARYLRRRDDLDIGAAVNPD